MKEIIVKTYSYEELSETAKEKAIEWYLSGQDFSFEWESLQEDAKNIGIKLTEWDYRRYCNGDLLTSAETVCDKILEEHGECCETYKTAKEYRKKFSELFTLHENEDVYDSDEYQELKDDFLKSILEDYRVMADKEYEYTQSEEYIKETMEANDYTFLENGKRF